MSDWIKVSDRLPRSGKKVLIFPHKKIGFYTKSGCVEYEEEAWFCSIENCQACENCAMHTLDEGWYEEIDEHGRCESFYDSLEGVTHWMPLPEPPEEQEK